MPNKTITIELNIDPELQKFLKQGWTLDDSRECLQAVEDEMSRDNWRIVFRYMQSLWKPLSDGYRWWKQKNFPGRQIWELTGETMQSLNTPVKLSAAGGSARSKSIRLEYQSMKATAVYKIHYPAAGGYFAQLNSERPIWRIMPIIRDRIQNRMKVIITNKVKGMLG